MSIFYACIIILALFIGFWFSRSSRIFSWGAMFAFACYGIFTDILGYKGYMEYIANNWVQASWWTWTMYGVVIVCSLVQLIYWIHFDKLLNEYMSMFGKPGLKK